MGNTMALNYDGWQSLLSAAFLSPHDGPTIFFIDENELKHLASHIKDAPGDLVEAVRSRLRLGDGREIFASIIGSYRRWKRGPRIEAPPILPLLAVTVLAATQMRTDAQARSTNYYLRLAQVLMPCADMKKVEALRNNLREGGAFLDVVEMWQGLHNWIEGQNGVVGLSTIRDHPQLQRIGYPLSQALVRESDLRALTRLFHALDLDPDTRLDPEMVLPALDIWTSVPYNRLSNTFMRGLADRDLRPLLARVVEAHAQAWDGRVLTNDGKQRIAVGLGIDLDTWEAHWLFPIPPDGPENLSMTESETAGEVILVGTSGIEYYYSVLEGPAVNETRLLSGMRLHSRNFTAEFPPSPVLFLRLDPYSGAWSSASGILPFEDHLVAVSSAHERDFWKLLREAAAEGWHVIPQLGSKLLPGYTLVQGVRFTDGPALELALSRLPALRGIGVAPVFVPRARLVYGLPIAAAISANHYLVGAEPDLLLPSGPNRRTVTVILDGRSEQLQANGFPLELRRFMGTPGQHVLEVDGQKLTFVALEEGHETGRPSGTGDLGWINAEAMGGEDHDHVITGGLIPDAGDSTPVLARRSRDESWLLHKGGRIESLTEPPPPQFLTHLDNKVHLPCFEIDAPSTVRWLAQRRGTRWRLTEVGPASPSEYDLGVDVLTAWQRACSDTNGLRLWQLQLSMARIAA